MDISKAWKRTIDDGFAHQDRDMWNSVVRNEVDGYNRRLANTPGYVRVDDRIVLAMVWVESGGPLMAAWRQRAMQIGNAGDPGLDAINNRKEASSVVVDFELLARVEDASRADVNQPSFNIQIGTAYLFTRMAISTEGTILDASDGATYEHVVGKGDTSASQIANDVGTTLEEMGASNPGMNLSRLSRGQTLRYRKASIGRFLTGWRAFTPAVIALRYNKGDPNYAGKLLYVLAYLER